MMVAIAKVSDVYITDANRSPVANGSMVPFNSSLVCSTPYDSRYNFTYSWTNVYSSQVVTGNTLTLQYGGSFEYRCTLERVVPYIQYTTNQTVMKPCKTSRATYVYGRLTL